MVTSINMPSGPIAAKAPANAIHLRVGADYQAIVNAAPTNATFFFESGEHRLSQAIAPKSGQTFLGADGAVIDGSRHLTTFGHSGSLFFADGQTQEGQRLATGESAPGAVRGGYPETFFIDGHALAPVASLSAVKAGSFFFDYAADRIYFGDNPAGHKVEAGFAAAAFQSSAANVTIKNLVVEQFDAPTQHGAIQGGQNWTVQNNEVRLNYGVGITVQGGSHVTGNDVHDNGQMGIGGNGANIVVSGNEIHSNGFTSGIDPFWEGGGTKFAQTTNLLVQNNYSHDNHGFGLWTDIDNVGTRYEGNLVVRNDGGGITHEISYDAVIHDNTLIGNGTAPQGANWLWGGQITLQNSGNVDVSGNRIDMSGGVNGIALIQQDRGTGAHGAHTTTNNHIHDNVLVSTGGGGMSGGVADFNEAGLLNGGNVFSNNQYHMDGGNHWRWGDFPSGDTWSAYRHDTGQDAGSTLSSAMPNTSSWLSGSAPTPAVTPPVVVAPPVVTAPTGPATPTAPAAVGADIVGTKGNDVLYGRGGALEIYGLAGNDTIHGSSGNELLYGGKGADLFVFSAHSGRDSIEDFELSGSKHDRIQLPKAYFHSFADVVAATHEVGHDAVIGFAHSSIALNETSISQMSADHFVFG